MGEDICQIIPLFYYAEVVSTLKEYIYHYNQLNESSYCYEIRTRSNIDKWQQIRQTALFVESFFKDKEPWYQKASHEFAGFFMRSNLRNAARTGEINYYVEMKDLIHSDYMDCYGVIGFNNPIVRGICFNYTLLRLIIRPATFLFFRILNPLKDIFTNRIRFKS